MAHQYISANETGRKEIVDAHEEMEYVFETALNIYNSAKADGLSDEVINNKIKNKLGSLLFVELQWIYSTDSLGNTLSNKMGYVVSNYDDENGSWVSDFAVGARNIMASIVNGDTSALNETNIVTSNYGYHIIKIENVFESGASLVDMSGFDKEDISLDNAEFVSEMISRLKGTYVCTSSNQTLYDYYYESIYNEFIGTSESNGTYFSKLQYEWLKEYIDADLIKYYELMDYEELMDSIG